MNAKISVTCYKSKILSNGEAPLMVKITKNGKRSLKTLGISLNPKYWDFERDRPKSSCPNRIHVVSIITNALQKYQAIQLDMEAKQEDYTASEILTSTATKTRLVTVGDFLTSHIHQLRDNGKVGNSYAYLNLRTTLQNFYGKKLTFLFNAVDVSFCNKFEAWMRKNQFEDTTMHYYFRTLRATYNKAVEAKCADREKSPFVEYKFRLNSGRAQYIRNGGKLGRKVGSIKTQEQKKGQYKDIISYLKRGYSIRTIATLTGKGISTVQRIKKDFNL